MKTATRRLTPRQAAFVRGVAAGKTAAQAARDAGYAHKFADRQAFQLLENARVQVALAELTAKLASPEIALAADRQGWWTTVMRDDDQDMKDRLKASELLGRAQGDFIERHGGPDGEPLPPSVVNVYVPDNGRHEAIHANGNGRKLASRAR